MSKVGNNNAAAEAARKAAEEAARKAAEEAARKAAEEAARKAAEEAARKAQEKAAEEAKKKATESAKKQQVDAAQKNAEVQKQQQVERAEAFKKTGEKPALQTDKVAEQKQQADLTKKLEQPKQDQLAKNNELQTQTLTQESQLSLRKKEASLARKNARSQLLRGTTGQADNVSAQNAQQPTSNIETPNAQLQDEQNTTSLTSAPSTLKTEDREDTNVNCLDKTHDAIQDMSPQERANTDVVFLKDKTNADGNDAGHVMLRGKDGTLTDPSNPESAPKTMEELRQEGRYEPVMKDGEPYAMPADQFDKIMSQTPSERDLSGVPKEVTEMKLADTATPKEQTFGPGDTLTNDGLKSAIDRMADERGESGRLSFTVKGEGGGLVKAGVEVEVGTAASKTDTGKITLSIDAKLAGKLGIDLGVAELGIKADLGGKVTARFANSEDAATWLGQKFKSLNESADDSFGTPMFDTSKVEAKGLSAPPTFVVSTSSSAGVYAKTKKIPGIPDRFEPKGEVSVTGTSTGLNYYRPDGSKIGQGHNTATTVKIDGEVAGFKGTYQFKRTNVHGDPASDNNGTYHNHKFTVEIDPSKVKTPAAAKKAVMASMGLTQEPAEGSTEAKMLNEGVTALQSAIGKQKSGTKFGFSYEVNKVREFNKATNEYEYNTQYSRFSMHTSTSTGVKADAKVGKFEVSAKYSKSEVLAESIGTQTESYVKQVALRSEEKDWEQFKQDNQSELKEMFGDKDIEKLRDGWRTEDKEFKQKQEEMGRIVDDIIANDTFLQSNHAMTELHRIGDERRAKVFDELARRGYSDEDIKSMSPSTLQKIIGGAVGSSPEKVFNKFFEGAEPHRAYPNADARALAHSFQKHLDPTSPTSDLARHSLATRNYQQIETFFNKYKDNPKVINQFFQQMQDAGLTRGDFDKLVETVRTRESGAFPRAFLQSFEGLLSRYNG